MIERVFDANGNEIGSVEYRDLTAEEINGSFIEDVEKAKTTLRKNYAEMQREYQKKLNKCTDENIRKLIRDDYKEILERDVEDRIRNLRHTLLTIDLNGKYFKCKN